MSVKDIAQEFTRLCKEGKFEEAGQRFWSDRIVSLEPMDGPMARSEGLAVKAKGDWWYQNHEVHSAVTDGPYVHGNQFAVKFTMDLTPKTGERAGQRLHMEEIGLYTVQDDRIVEERFFFGG
ncbi:MAG: SnoaL-like domain-containing protein [Ramlibacter sp.]